MKLSMNKIKLWFAIILAGIMITGCNVAENLDDCDIELEFSFRFIKEGIDQFGNEVSSLDIYIFDDQGNLVKKLIETDRSKFNENFKMSTTLPPGTYNAVIWGGLNPTQYTYPTTASEFTASTFTEQVESANAKVKDKAGIVDYRPSDMFYGNKFDISLVQERPKETALIDLVKNSTQINLKISGLPLPLDKYDVSFYSANGSYDYLNHLNHADPEVTLRYNALDETTDANDNYYASFNTYRLVFGKENKLVIWDKTENKLFYTADLLEDFIRKDPRYDTQAKVDAEDVFNIFISFDTYMRVSVSINGWDVQISNPGPIY